MGEPRYDHAALTGFATALFQAAGLDADKAETTASYLIEADLLGHDTHGLAQAPGYLGAIRDGGMASDGNPKTVRDHGAVLTWDGMRLPGLWLTVRAIDTALARVWDYGTATVAIRRSHHIGCLAAFLQRATDQGKMLILTCSDPSVKSIAPYGGTEPLYTPDPIAVGIPTPGDPILIDISASITTNGMTGRLNAQGRKMPGQWAIDADGAPSNDPAVLFTDPPGTILPVGGLEYGHKGFGLGLIVEALTQGLAGHGRATRLKAGARTHSFRSSIPQPSAASTPLPGRPAGWPMPPGRTGRGRALSGCACQANAGLPGNGRCWKAAWRSIRGSWMHWPPGRRGWTFRRRNRWANRRRSFRRNCGRRRGPEWRAA